MNNNSKTLIIKDLKEKSILVSRVFTAPIDMVWRAYTEKEWLDRWWGPQPWRAETKTLNFSVGGFWLYAMVSPENEKHWGRMDFTAIVPQESIGIKDSFCDEEGNINPSLPVSSGTITFFSTNKSTLVEFKMVYSIKKEIQTIIEMGFEQGITICLDQLEKLFEENKL